MKYKDQVIANFNCGWVVDCIVGFALPRDPRISLNQIKPLTYSLSLQLTNSRKINSKLNLIPTTYQDIRYGSYEERFGRYINKTPSRYSTIRQGWMNKSKKSSTVHPSRFQLCLCPERFHLQFGFCLLPRISFSNN